MLDYIITGTRAFGPAMENSDLDIVVLYNDVNSIHAFLLSHNIPAYTTLAQYNHGDEGGFYFDLAGIKVNIIIATDKEEFEVWRERTDGMKKLKPIECKGLRHSAFNAIKPNDPPFVRVSDNG